MDENKYRKWDLILKTATLALTVIMISLGICQYVHQNRLNFKRKIWEKQLDVYMETCHVVSNIVSNSDNTEKYTQLAKQFYALYWGKTIFIEDKEVSEAMIDVKLAIQDFLKENITEDDLKKKAEYFVKTCRKSSEKGWTDIN